MLALLVAAPANAHRQLRHDHFELSYWPLPVFGQPSVPDPTVDTQQSEELFWRPEEQRISVSQRTTTTQVISFSPDRWPVDVAFLPHPHPLPPTTFPPAPLILPFTTLSCRQRDEGRSAAARACYGWRVRGAPWRRTRSR